MSRASRCASAAPCGMAASACRGRGLGGFTARAASADGPRASRASAGTRPAPAPSARRSRSAWSFDRFFTDGLSGRRWEGFEPSTGFFRSCSTRLSYTTVEAIRESNPAPCGAIHRWPHQLLRTARHARHRRTDPDAAHRRGGLAPEPRPVSVRLLQPIPGRPGFSPGAIPSAGAQPAIHARRPGCAALRAESPRSGSARTAGTRAASPPPPACGRPSCRCSGRRR